MRWISVVVAISILVILFGIAYGLVVLGISGPPAPADLRMLGSRYLYYMINQYERNYTAESPEAVSAILWDYRGLDTLYETMVLFSAIIGGILVYREFLANGEEKPKREYGLSLIVRTVSKIIVWLTLITALTLGFTGQLTPGGGFVGGAAFAVIPILLVLVYSIEYIRRIGFTHKRALTLRTTALLALLIVIIAPFMLGGYIFQNQAKPGAYGISYPGRFIDSTPLGGSLFFLNIAELFAVAGAFTLSFLLLALVSSSDQLGDNR